METHGRLGRRARAFLSRLACHSAACQGGSEDVVRRRCGIIRRSLALSISATIARAVGERILAYVRGCTQAGRALRPVSALLSCSA